MFDHMVPSTSSIRPNVLAGLGVAVAVAVPLVVRADVLVLTQPAVAQYQQVVEAFHQVSPAPVVDVADECAVSAALTKEPEVVVAVGTRAFEVARTRAARSAVVATAVLNPDAGGRKDVTAVPMAARAAEAVAVLASLTPSAKRVVAFYAPSNGHVLTDAKGAARKAGLEIEFKAVAEVEGFEAVFQAQVMSSDAVWLLPDPRLARPEMVKFMVGACLQHKVALIGFLQGITRAGALASVAPDLAAIGREAAHLSADLAAWPKEKRTGVPFQFAPGKIWVNERTRELLGLAGAAPATAEVIR